MKKVEIIFSLVLFFSFAITFVSSQSVLSEPSFCCERTVDGAYCLNAEASQCAEGYKSSPTSCETTSYCKLGTCYDSEEGVCMENTPQVTCEEGGGTWDAREINEVAQCQLGCCIISDQAAFVPLVRCKRLSTFFGVENNYDSTITSEVACIAEAQGQDMGACVYEEEFELVCEFTTRADCGAEEGVLSIEEESGNNRRFYKDMLCSAEELNTNCARQASTTCHNGDVYWMDSCGNRENVYSANKEISWNGGRVAEPEEVCDPSDGTDSSCGNCDYYQGTRCEEWDGLLGVGRPAGSDHFCQRTECVDRFGNERINGESWCVYDSDVGLGLDKVGSRHFREVCVDGDVRVEPCADFRNEICLQGEIEIAGGDLFGTSGCRVNRWRDCILQTEEEDCTNIDRRDCMWITDTPTGLVIGSDEEGSSGQTIQYSNPTNNPGSSGNTNQNGGGDFSNPTFTGNAIAPITGNAVVGEGEERQTVGNRDDGVCLPMYPPGLDFWGGENTQETCGLATSECVVKYEKGLLGGSEIVEGKECLEEEWAMQANRICSAMGDCGGYVNFVDVYTDEGYNWYQEDYGENGKREFSPNSVNRIKGGFLGMTEPVIFTGREEQ